MVVYRCVKNAVVLSFALAIPSKIVAEPMVLGASGNAVENMELVIWGEGFKTRNDPSPYFVSDFERAGLGESAVDAGLDDLGNDRRGMPEIAGDKSLSGTQSLAMDFVEEEGSMFPRVGVGGLNADEVYVSVWTYWERTAFMQSAPFIFKMVRGGENPPYSGVPRFHETIRPNDAGVIQSVADRGSVASDGTQTKTREVNAGTDAGGWHRSEYYYKLSTPGQADGIFQTHVDGILNGNLIGTMSRVAGSSAKIRYVMSPFNGIDSYGIGNAYRLWIDDFYVDTTRARVELGNGATIASATKRHIQPTTRWSDDSISVKVNAGDFINGQEVYLYVFDHTGAVNFEGYPIQVVNDTTQIPLPPTVIEN